MWERIIRKINAAVTSDKEKEIGAEPISELTACILGITTVLCHIIPESARRKP